MITRNKQDNVWENETILARLESLRKIKKVKTKRRQTFDCYNATADGLRVWCKKGRALGTAKDGSLSLLEVLRGNSTGVCLTCHDFDGD